MRGLHFQEQSWHPRERNHLTAHLDLHKDDLGLSGSVACLNLRGKLEVEALYTRPNPTMGVLGSCRASGVSRMAKAVKGFSIDMPSTK